LHGDGHEDFLSGNRLSRRSQRDHHAIQSRGAIVG